jgi:hypothetical protein
MLGLNFPLFVRKIQTQKIRNTALPQAHSRKCASDRVTFDRLHPHLRKFYYQLLTINMQPDQPRA